MSARYSFSRIGILKGGNTLSGHVAAIRSREEIEDAINAFTPDHWARLKRVAGLYAAGRPIEAEDLLQKALMQAVSSRHCPTHVDVVKFLAEAMRSIADGEKEKVEHKLTVVSATNTEERHRAYLNHADPSVNIEKMVIDEESAEIIRRQVFALFDDDPKARDLLEGKIEDLSAEEMRELTGLDKTTYDSKWKLIRRRIAGKYPKGWTQ